MKTRSATAIVAIGALALTAAASAGVDYNPALDYTISINDGNPFNATADGNSFSIAVPDTGGTVVGFSFEGRLNITAQGFPEFPRYTQLAIENPDGDEYLVGGASGFDTPWDFQSVNASPPNTLYRHGLGGDAWAGDGLPDFALPDSESTGLWEFTFTRTAGSGIHQWQAVEITLHSIPAPGALALLGLAGLVGTRRRRA